MVENKNKSRLVMVLTAAVTFAVCTWLFANWDGFKAGLAGEAEPPAKSRP